MSQRSLRRGPATDGPREWVDGATGRRVRRLSREPGTTGLYFHQNACTAAGDLLVVRAPGGLDAVDLRTGAIERVVEGPADRAIVGRRTRQVYYVLRGIVHSTHLDTGATRAIAQPPGDTTDLSGLALNADETLLAGSEVEDGAEGRGRRPPGAGPSGPPPDRPDLKARREARLPMRLYTIDIATGAVRTVHRSTEWLNHVQCSPADPGLIMFCHEGPWHEVDRIWVIRADGSGLRRIHARTMPLEIAGHEFWSADGATIWYDLQTPRSQAFWLAGHALATGETARYRVARSHWSVHYNVRPDGAVFAGDGGGPRSIAAPGAGQWIYLLTPGDGELRATRLVDLSAHDYRLEPNVAFLPGGDRIVFTSNLHGPAHVYAVDADAAGAG